MLKGSVKIELTDVKTGEVKTHEQHNLVTDNVQFMLNYADPANLLPLYQKAMGQLLLFDDEITENDGTELIGYPKESKLVGYANRTLNTELINSGSYNVAESSGTTDSFTSVWDFSTSQLNGTIGALALMPAISNYNGSVATNPYSIKGINGRTMTADTHTITYRLDETITSSITMPTTHGTPIYFDKDSGYLYFIQYGAINSDIHIIISRIKYIMDYGVIEPAYSTYKTELVKEFELTDMVVTCVDRNTENPGPDYEMDLRALNQLCWYDGDDGYVYAIGSGVIGSTTTSRIYYAKYKAYDLSFDLVGGYYIDFEDTDFTTSPHYFDYRYRSSYDNNFLNRYASFAAVCGDKFFVTKGTPTQNAQTTFSGFYIIDREDITDIQEINSGVALTIKRTKGIRVLPKGVILCELETGHGLIYMDGTIKQGYYSPTSETDLPHFDYTSGGLVFNGRVSMQSNDNGLQVSPLLSTICNLSSPVTKTAAQTMKVTYTLTSYLPMYIDVQPHDTSGTTGETIQLSIVVREGSGTYEYQWEVSSDQTTWADCSEQSATTNELELILSSSNTNKYYRCTITDSLNSSVTSVSAYVTLST